MTWLAPIATVVLLAASALLAVPAVVLFVQLATATWDDVARRRSLPVAAGPRPGRLAVLMAAHDEAAGIAAPVRAVLAQLRPGDRLLVVADNCSDATAPVARSLGAEVVERHDPVRRGKGYALDFGVRWLERDPSDCVVIVDADCVVEPGALDTLARASLASGRPVQALYLMEAPAGARVGLRIAQFAWRVKNKLRPRGFAAWGLPCPLMGTGMAFPWAVIAGAPLATGHLVEDMQLGLDLAAAGTPPLFCEEALVSSVFPTDAEGAASQRTRWEHGHLSVIASVAPGLVAAALRRGDGRLLAMALDLCVPPLASLVLAMTAMLLVDALAWSAGVSVLPFAVAACAWALLAAGVLSAWVHDGRRIVSATDLFALPLYILAKIPVYVRLLTKRQVEWVRTRRDDRRSP